MRQKRGLSAIVATLIIILLTLVAVGIIWVVIRNVIQSGAEQVDLSSKCTAVDIRPTAATCVDSAGNWSCSVTYTRSAGGDNIDGLRIVLSNGLTSYSQDFSGNLAAPGTATQSGMVTTILSTTAKPNSVQVAPYFLDSSGNPGVCNPTSTFTNVG